MSQISGAMTQKRLNGLPIPLTNWAGFFPPGGSQWIKDCVCRRAALEVTRDRLFIRGLTAFEFDRYMQHASVGVNKVIRE